MSLIKCPEYGKEDSDKAKEWILLVQIISNTLSDILIFVIYNLII